MKETLPIVSLIFLLISSCTNSPSSKIHTISTQIQTANGPILGSLNKDQRVLSFKGIPYATAPIGDLRWRPPVPVESWTELKDCREFKASPIQAKPSPFYMWSSEFLIPEEPISEDGLYLNIWAPKKYNSQGNAVMVYIHGGGFASGSGSVPIYDGEAMAKKGIVFVSINYRLGLFGFLAHPELSQESITKTSGNYGLLDQISALQWIQNNISFFGGNPSNVTIAGQSAGAASVAFLMASPLAKGLFHKAIAQSGAGILPRNPNSPGLGLQDLKTAEATGIAISEKLGLSIEEMRKIPANQLFSQVNFRGHPILDGHVIPDEISTIYTNAQQAHIPLITGWNEDAGIVIGGFQSPADFTKNIAQQWGSSSKQLLKFYPASDQKTAEKSQEYLQRDLVFGAQNYTMANLISKQGLDVFVYRFKRDLPDGKQPDFGAFHTGEVPYAYNNLHTVDRPFETEDFNLADLMSSYWVNFAKNSNPNSEELPNWNPYSAESKNIMIFDKEQKQSSLEDAETLDFLVETLLLSKNVVQ